MKAYRNDGLHRWLLTALLMTYGALTLVLAAIGRPGEPALAVVVALICGGGALLLHRRGVWEVHATEAGIECRSGRTGEEQLLRWADCRFACELAGCVLVSDRPMTRSALMRACRRCVLTGDCMRGGCVCLAPESTDALRARGIAVRRI